MSNEPVAWMTKLYSPDIGEWWDWSDREKEGYTPLYTHPVNPKYDPETGEPLIDGYPLFSGLPHPVKELTDEEIEEVIRKHWNKQYGNRNMLTLCKAVLKEANK